MKGKQWVAAGCLIAGIPLAAFGLAGGGMLLTLVGLALVLGFWFLAWQWISGAGKPATPIKPSANAAWNLRDEAVKRDSPANSASAVAGSPSARAPAPSPLAPSPSPSPASGGGEQDGGASRRGEE